MRGNTITIELPLKRGKVSKAIPLYQYDYGQNLVITGAELPSAYEVHFSNEMHGEAVTAIGGSTGVAIPDSVLTSGDPIYLWLYLHEDSTDGETEFQGVIPVIKRASISDQTPTPAEQSAITEAIAALNTAVTDTTAAKNAAVAAQTHIENMSVTASSTTPEAGASVTKTVNAQGEVNLAFAIPRGDKGDKGDQGLQGEAGTNGTNGTNGVSPVVSMSKSDGTVTLSITDATHTDTVEINDGEPGDPTDLIDDDAGSGDTDVTWSANKLANLTTTVGSKADLVSSPTEGNFAALTSGGNLTDSGHKHSDYLTSHQDITGKADKVSSATNGNFAGLDSNGNLTDSGSKAADFLTAHQDITGKADKVSSATNGNFAGLDSNGNLTDSGHKHSDYLTSHQDISGKSDLTNLAAAFSTSATYAVGDHVTYDGKYYVCSTAISTAGSWDSSKWTEKTVGGETSALLSEIQQVDKFLGDTSTDLGTHTITTETDLTDMTASTQTVSNVKYIVTKTTINADGTATANSLKVAQDNISLDAGYYYFALDKKITSANYQIQLFSITGNTVLKAFTYNSTIPEYYFTLDSATSVRVRAFVTNGGSVSNETHTVTLKKITKQTYDNNVAYYLMGLGATENVNYTDIEIGGISGTDGSTAGNNARCRTKDYISIDDFVLCDLHKEPNYDLFVFLYGSDKSFLERIPASWSNTNYTHDDIVTANANAKYIKILFKRHNDANIESIDIADMKGVIFVKKSESSIESFDGFRSSLVKSRFDNQFNYIAYSVLSSNDAPANTAEHFTNCGKQIFTALKGDVRNTSDGGLIMCHDPGYTFDGNSKITTYDASNKTLINTLTVAQCKALTFATQYNSSDVRPTDFDTYVKICKKYGKIAFVTVRDEAISTVVAPNVIATLKKYRMLDRAIINSFTYSTLKKFREYDSEIMLSLVLNQNTAPSISTVDMVMDLGNCILNLFDVPLPSGSSLETVLTGYDPVLHYAINNNVPIYEAQTQNTHTDTLLAHGITGTQMTQIPDYMT